MLGRGTIARLHESDDDPPPKTNDSVIDRERPYKSYDDFVCRDGAGAAGNGYGGVVQPLRHSRHDQRSLLPFDRPAVRRKKLTVDFDGGNQSSDAGLLLLPAFSTSSISALGAALIASSRSRCHLCGGLLSRQPSDLTRRRVPPNALLRPWRGGRRADHHL
jgi:hypothetical protein